VTLCGPAGIGKTRLALRYAELHGDGASFCDLTTANGLVDLCDVVARSLHIALGSTATSEALVDRVGAGLAAQANPLIVLDNCEHIVPHAASALARWARAATSTCFLATSRELLGIVGEQAYEVVPLRLPSGEEDEEAEAVRLFVDRSRLVRQDRSRSPDDRGAVAALVRQLDGLPLAIELAAGCTDVFTPRELLRGASGHLDELASRARTPAERHRTLRAAISGSWKLLRPW
jgi:predicted ATPase